MEIERFALRAAILHVCHNYLGCGGGLGGSEKNFSRPIPGHENHDTRDGKTRYL